jgi:hypothetical protein
MTPLNAHEASVSIPTPAKVTAGFTPSGQAHSHPALTRPARGTSILLMYLACRLSDSRTMIGGIIEIEVEPTATGEIATDAALAGRHRRSSRPSRRATRRPMGLPAWRT